MFRLTKVFLRVWITATSLAAFGLGWAVLAHSPKPAPLLSSQPAAASWSASQLPPIPSLAQLQTGGPSISSGITGSLSMAPSADFNPPPIRTRGS